MRDFLIVTLVCVCCIKLCSGAIYGEACISPEECIVEGQTCVGGICDCNTVENYSYINGKCVKDINECAENLNDCDTNADCTNTLGSYFCACKVGFAGDGISCFDINKCEDVNDCDVNADCTNTQGSYNCACKTGFTGTGSSCIDIDECVDVNDCDVNADCTNTVGSYICACKTGFTGNGSSCIDIDKRLGEGCTGVPTECRSPYAKCLDGKCTCSNDSYDSNGFTEGGNCYHVSNLRVTAITFPPGSVKTSGFTVNWTPPSGNLDLASQISSYVIDWRLKTQDSSLTGGNEEVASSETSLVIRTGVTPGKTYTLTVTSKNIWTQKNFSRTTSLSKEQAAKPGKPGPIDKQKSDLHANSGSPGITLYWNVPSGGVSDYRVTISDETDSTSTYHIAASGIFTPSWLKNGHRYNVTIQARSETFDNGNVVLGEVHREEIKTVVTVPTAPRSVSCAKIYGESIVLSLYEPTDKNGDHVKYVIDAYGSNETKLLTTNTAEDVQSFTVENLSPGTWYRFKVFTQNELYKSEASAETTCVTKAKCAEFQVVECNCAMQSVVIGVVLGIIIVLLSVYASYATLLIRRYRANKGDSEVNNSKKNDHRGQMYVNESFAVGGKRAQNNAAADRDSETHYSSLDDSTRDDRTTYDRIQTM